MSDDKEHPDINQTLLDEGVDAVRKRHDEAWRARRADKRTNGQPRDYLDVATKPSDKALPPPLLSVNRIFPIDGKAIPPRDWIIPGLLLRRHVTVLVAPTAAGKSVLTIHIGLACATKTNWAGWQPRAKSRVMFINSEDDGPEMARRQFAAATTMGLEQQELAEQVICVAEDDGDIIIAKYDPKKHEMVKKPLLERLVATIIAYKIDIVFVDPFAETFDGDENSNNELKWAAVLWREVARRTNAAVCLVHHTKKYATGMAGDVDAARGAGALVGVARIVSTVFTMTKKEAATMDIAQDDRVRYIRYDDAKANLNLITRQARWFRKDTFQLRNERAELPGDQVGVLIPWKPTGLFDDVTQGTIDTLFAMIDRGLLDANNRAISEFYTAVNSQKKDDTINRWVGLLVAKTLGCDDARAKKLIAHWRKAGSLVDFKYRSKETRKLRTGCGSPAKKAEVERADSAPVVPLFPAKGADDNVRKRSSFQIIGPEPDAPCKQCGKKEPQVNLIRDPFRGVASEPLHEECAWTWYRRDDDLAPSRFRIVGKALEGSTCIVCHKSSGDVLKIKDAQQVGSKAETLHEGCAAQWFAKEAIQPAGSDDDDRK